MYPVKTKRGVYLDVSKSPYVFKTPYGDYFHFSSPKKLCIFKRELPNRIRITVNAYKKIHKYTGSVSVLMATYAHEVSATLYKEVEN